MKKIFSLIICLSFILSFSLVGKSSSSYTIDSEGFSISLPDTMYVFDRNTSPDDSRIQNLGLNYDALMSSFNSQDIYLDAMDTDNFNEIVVIVQPTSEPNYFDLKSGELYNTILAEEKRLTDLGREVLTSDLFEVGNVDFVKTVSKSSDAQIQYTTVYNGKKIKIRLIDFDKNITSDEEDAFEQIAESVSFKESPKTSADKKEVKGATDDPIEEVPVKEDGNSSKLIKKIGTFFIVLLVVILICTIPALIFRFVFLSGGIRSKMGSKVFAFIYSVLMSLLFYFILTKHKTADISILYTFFPLLWSFVIYKIVKK